MGHCSATEVFTSGWPGTRGYKWLVGNGAPIDLASVLLLPPFALYGLGAQSVAWRIIPPGEPNANMIEVSVTMHEGEAFNPKQHYAIVTITWRYL